MTDTVLPDIYRTKVVISRLLRPERLEQADERTRRRENPEVPELSRICPHFRDHHTGPKKDSLKVASTHPLPLWMKQVALLSNIENYDLKTAFLS